MGSHVSRPGGFGSAWTHTEEGIDDCTRPGFALGCARRRSDALETFALAVEIHSPCPYRRRSRHRVGCLDLEWSENLAKGGASQRSVEEPHGKVAGRILSSDAATVSEVRHE